MCLQLLFILYLFKIFPRLSPWKVLGVFFHPNISRFFFKIWCRSGQSASLFTKIKSLQHLYRKALFIFPLYNLEKFLWKYATFLSWHGKMCIGFIIHTGIAIMNQESSPKPTSRGCSGYTDSISLLCALNERLFVLVSINWLSAAERDSSFAYLLSDVTAFLWTKNTLCTILHCAIKFFVGIVCGLKRLPLFFGKRQLLCRIQLAYISLA